MIKEDLEGKIKQTEKNMQQAVVEINELQKQIFIMEGMNRSYKEWLNSLNESSKT